ncbi:hypothetical protein B0J12DRAFT_421674 [Macrophomina phaseolina]|uniref:Uncharacterized protein n=1 Tax=Macrophomina phaseolina TaxID=35725 RepID=A0ABQ8GJA0_9PEZI|nr:hypothetical protein B0J12DRAFT_421674 [Macrophomina phaseolina]
MPTDAVMPTSIFVHQFYALIILLLFLQRPASATSYVTVFSDSACKTSFNDWDDPNGYPDGVCTSFSEKATGRFSSFMFNELDTGCGVTIYTPDTTGSPCSGNAILATPYHCYNASAASYPYYSIDHCTPPDQLPSSASSSSSTAPASSASASIPTHTTIIAATLGTAAALLSLVGGAWFCVLRRRRQRRRRQQRDGVADMVEADANGSGGLGGVVGASEIGGAPVLEMCAEARFELEGKEDGEEEEEEEEEAAARGSGPVELPGDEGWKGGGGR